jgi:hypothetical protein
LTGTQTRARTAFADDSGGAEMTNRRMTSALLAVFTAADLAAWCSGWPVPSR